LGFNIYRLVEVVHERTATTQSLGFSAEELEVYEAKFYRHMTPRCFSRLLKHAQWREVAVGEVVSGPDECGFLLRGKAAMQVRGCGVSLSSSFLPRMTPPTLHHSRNFTT
jgi:hypothetical protein